MTEQKYPEYVPGLPIKRNNPCIDPEQSMRPHIEEVIQIKTNKKGKQHLSKKKTYAPNIQDYPEYEYLIKIFMKEHKLPIFDRTGIKHIDLRNYGG